MIYSFQNASFKDQQTGLYNEAYFMEMFYREWHRMLREHHALSVLVVHPQVDTNDKQGLEEFIQVAQLLGHCTHRATDLVSRFNDKKFIIGLFDLPRHGTEVVIERILASINDANVNLHASKNTFIGAVHVNPNQDTDINDVFNCALNIKNEGTAGNRDRNYHLCEHSMDMSVSH